MAYARVTLAALSAIWMGGCGVSSPAPASRAESAQVPSAPAKLASFEGTRWGMFHSKRFELTVGLPDGSAWKIDDHRSPWLRAVHEATHSKLAVRSWNEEQNVTRQACYTRAREWDPELPDLETSRLIEDQVRTLLKNQDARVAVGVTSRPAPSSMIGGFVVAIVGTVRHCFVVAFQTEADGPSAQDEVADRLAVVSERLLPTLKLDPTFAPSREPATMPSGSPGRPAGER